MATFIKLTRGNYLNAERVAWIQDNSSTDHPGSRVYFSGEDNDYMLCVETPEQILALIQAAKES